MIQLLVSISAITLYMICTLLLIIRLRSEVTSGCISKSTILITGFIGLVAHLFVLKQSIFSPVGVNLGFFTAASLVGAFITAFTLIAACRHPIEMLGALVLPVSSLAIILDITNASSHLLPPGSSAGLIIHILISLIAYSLLGLATIHAMVFSLQNSYLRDHQPGGFIKALPPLLTMEALLFETISLGFIFLSVSLVTGLFFLENMFDQHLAHKTVLSIFAWLVYATLLYGRYFRGWRGRIAIRWTLCGFFFLVLAYFGSKFVLEILLV